MSKDAGSALVRSSADGNDKGLTGYIKPVPVTEPATLHRLVVDARPVGTAEVLDHDLIRLAFDPAMPPRNPRDFQDYITLGRPPHDRRRTFEDDHLARADGS